MNWQPAARYLWTQWVRPLALPALVIFAAKSAFADINYVPSGSMKPTILEGDVLLINKLAYDLKVPFTRWRVAEWSHPARGDIVVCFSPQDGTRLVKRVVGLPGDTVEMRDEVLYLNGARVEYGPLDPARSAVLPESERTAAIFAEEKLGDRRHGVMALPRVPAKRTFAPVKVPAGQYLLLGDNRDNSHDSRFFGLVARREIVGRAEAVFVSADLNNYLKPRFGRWCTALR